MSEPTERPRAPPRPIEVDSAATVVSHPGKTPQAAMHQLDLGGPLEVEDTLDSRVSPRDPDPGPPQIGRYTLRRWLGAGGMGAVYEAEDPSLARPVAIKLLHGAVEEEARRRMEREAKALAKLSHPNVVQIYEIGRSEGRTFIAMELVRGQTLDVWHEGQPTWRRCVEIYLQAGRGLAAAHAQGLVHRDFKPSNCMLGDDGRVRVLDFGLARAQPQVAAVDATAHSDGAFEGPADQLTQTGSFVGTPAYVPLEQLEGRQVDAASDQFSYCVSLYEALHGERPFSGGSAGELAVALASGEIRAVGPSDRAAVPPRVRRILRRGLSRSPSDRWPSMDALMAELAGLVQPRRRRWALALLGGGLLATGAGLWQQARVVGQRCGGAQEELAGVWDDARQQQIHDAMQATALPYVDETWLRVRTELSSYAARWTQMHTATCQATHVRKEQTEDVMALRMACLGRRKIRLTQVTEVLAHADAQVVERAVNLVAALPRVARCEDVQALRAEVAPPEDPQVRQRVQAIRQVLARVAVLESVGRYQEAERQLETLAEQADVLGYGPLTAELDFRLGSVLQSRGNDGPAAVALERAFTRAVEHGHDTLAAEAASLLSFVVGSMLEDVDRGLWWATTALAFARRTGDPMVLGSALAHHGLVLNEAGRLSEAEGQLTDALALLQRTLGPDHPHVAAALGGLANNLEARGDPNGALEHLERGLQIDQRALGSDHPFLATDLGNIGRLMVENGDVEAGRAKLRRASVLYERAGNSAGVAQLASSLARAAYRQGDLDGAAAELERAMKILEGAGMSEHPAWDDLIANLGVIRMEQGQVAQAEVLFRRGLALREGRVGRDSPRTAVPLWNVAMVLMEQERFADVLPLLRRSAAIQEKIHGPNHTEVADAWVQLATALEGLNQRSEARRYMQTAARIYGDLAGPDPDAAANEAVVTVEQWLGEHPAG